MTQSQSQSHRDGRVALLGGTFNPVHIGHLYIAEVVLAAGNFDRVLFVPTHLPAHKPADELVSSNHRMRMVQQAIDHQPRFAVSDVELRRPGTSYTIDTLRDLRRHNLVQSIPGLVLGDDLIAEYRTWRQHEQLAAEVSFLVARRLPSRDAHAAARSAFDYPHLVLDNAVLDVSSTLLRGRVRRGQVVRHLVPDAVLDYINRNRLYRTPP